MLRECLHPVTLICLSPSSSKGHSELGEGPSKIGQKMGKKLRTKNQYFNENTRTKILDIVKTLVLCVKIVTENN